MNLVIALILAVGMLASAPTQAQSAGCKAGFTPSNPDSAYVLYADGTVLDSRTHLMWKRCRVGQTWNGTACAGTATMMDWPTALTTAANATFAGHTDWRLPSIRELRTLIEYCRNFPAINTTVFSGGVPGAPWSGTPVQAGSPVTYDAAWVVLLLSGDIRPWPRDQNSDVRLVRGGQVTAAQP